jgi:transposase
MPRAIASVISDNHMRQECPESPAVVHPALLNSSENSMNTSETPLLKQVVGVDVASTSLVVAIGTISYQQQITRSATAEFENSATGIAKLLNWIEKHHRTDLPIAVVMEATGVYHERLAVALHEHGLDVAIVLPNKIKHFAQSLNLKSKTDVIDAEVIMRYGLERQIPLWHPPTAILSQIKALVREHADIQQMLTEVRNRLHAADHAAAMPKHIIKRLRQHRELLKKQLKQIEQELNDLLADDEELSERAECLDSIPGVGRLTAVSIIAETNNFALFEQASQLVSYSGLDPQLRQSGRWVGKTTISGRGNSHIRRILYMPTLAAIRFNKPLQAVYQRLLKSKGQKMVAVTAVMRKLLVLMFTLVKKRQHFDPLYHTAAAAADH